MLRPFLFNVIVWGENYTRQLLEFTIPSLLSLNNLPKLVKHRPCEFLFVTTYQDAELIKSSEIFRKLASYTPTLVIYQDFHSMSGSKYQLMTTGHRHVCMYGQKRKAYGVFLMPEMLVADGSLLYMHQSVLNGFRAVVMPVLRLVEEEVSDLRGKSINLSKRQLVRLLFAHPHDEMRSFMIDNEVFTSEPGFVIWPNGGSYWIIHGLHSQPVLVDLKDAVYEALEPTIDAGNFVELSVKNYKLVDIVQDSDQAMICSLTSKYDIPTPHSWTLPTPESVRKFIRGTPYMNRLHLWYFSHPVVFHAGSRPKSVEAGIEISTSFVAEVLGR
jgi:hypothetical protein